MSRVTTIDPHRALGTGWTNSAACRDGDVELFFTLDGERGESRLARERVAKAICQRCSVRRCCLDHAMAHRETYGVWGGMSEEERVAEHRRRAQSRPAR